MDHGRMNGSQPHWCCSFCGESYGHRECSEHATWHIGECEACGDEEVPVTNPREFGGLNDLWRAEV